MQEFDPSYILNKPLMANLATVSEDGDPCNSPVWFLWEDEVMWMPGSTSGSATRRIEANPRCAVEIVHFDNDAGILLHVGLRGLASVEPNCSSLFERLLAKYLGERATWNDWFIDQIARIDDPDARLLKLVPQSLFTNNVSYFRTGPSMAWPKAI